MAKGETVKYYIDADTSGFARGMGEAALESEVASKSISSNLNKTSKSSENNFKDIRKNAQTAASSIRNFGQALQGFNLTSILIGVAALSGAVLELSGAVAAAGSTLSILPGVLFQGAAAFSTYKTGVFGLSDAFKAVKANDGEAFRKSLANLGPAATQVAYAVGGLNKAFNGVRLNVQQAMLDGIGKSLLHLGAVVIPTLNAGMQRVGQALNGLFQQALGLGSSPLFNGLLATIFNDTANNVRTLGGALAPLLSIFTNLYLITRPYVALLAQTAVNLVKNLAAFLSSAKGQVALNIAIQQGIVAIQELGSFVGAAFGLLTSIFRTSVLSGESLIVTLTGIIRQAEAWVNSAKGQAQLAALFHFTAITVQAVASAIGQSLSRVFTLLQLFSSMNPVVQNMIVNFLAVSLTVRPLISYFAQLWIAVRTLSVTIFNIAQQAVILFGAFGAVASIAILLAGGLIILGSIIRGPLGAAFIVIGAAIALYIGLSYLLAQASAASASAFFEQGVAAMYSAGAESELAGINILVATTMYNTGIAALDAGAGMGFAASAASILQAGLLGIIIAAAGVVVILSILGVFGTGAKKATNTTKGFGSSLGGLTKAMKSMGGGASAVSNNGLADLNQSLNNVGNAAAGATGSLASFDKMNVLTNNNAGAGSGIPGLPSLPNIGTPALGAPMLDTGAFDKSLADMQKQFDGLQGKLGKPLNNPFAALGDYINKHAGPALIILGVIVGIIAAAFIAWGFAAIVAAIGISLTVGLVVLAVVAVIAIIAILYKNWDTIWKGIKDIAYITWQWIQAAWDGILNGAMAMVTAVGNFFVGLWQGIQNTFSTVAAWFGNVFQTAWNLIMAVWNVVVAWFQGVWNGIMQVFSGIGLWFGNVFAGAWNAIKTAWSAVTGWFQGVWNSIGNIFAGVGTWFGNIFAGAWQGIKNAFNDVSGFFQGLWNNIVNIFGNVGTSIGNAIGGSVKSVVNTILNTVSTLVNNVIDTINGAINLINKLPGVNVGKIGHIALPKLAKGGIVTQSTFAQIGENGAEAVMPLENNTQWIDMLANKINSSNGKSGGAPINLTVKIGEETVAAKIIELINEKTQMSGRNSILV